MQATIPYSKRKLTNSILDHLRNTYTDPVVEITEVQNNLIQIRVGTDTGSRYFTVKISEPIS